MNTELFWALPGCRSALLPVPGVLRPSTAVFFWKERGENERLHLTISLSQTVPQWTRPQTPTFLKIGLTKKKIQCGEMLNGACLYPALLLVYLSHSPVAEGQDACKGEPWEILKVMKQDAWNTLLRSWSWPCSYCSLQGSGLCKLISFLVYLPAWKSCGWFTKRSISGVAFATTQP